MLVDLGNEPSELEDFLFDLDFGDEQCLRVGEKELKGA